MLQYYICLGLVLTIILVLGLELGLVLFYTSIDAAGISAMARRGRYFMYRSRNIKLYQNPIPNPNTNMTVNTIPKQM